MQAVIMAGGKGSRLRPYTYVVPKPLLPLGKRPVLEVVIRRLRRFGYDEIFITTGYMADMVQAYFRDGSQFGVRIRYVHERDPLGTAGSLSLLRSHLHQTFLLMNCDIVTRLDIGAMQMTHRSTGAEITIAVKRYPLQIPYGVVELGSRQEVLGIVEKPVVQHQVIAGIYLMEPAVLDIVPDGEPYDIPSLVSALIAAGRPVYAYPFDDYWLDVGRADDLERAAAEVGEWLEQDEGTREDTDGLV